MEQKSEDARGSIEAEPPTLHVSAFTSGANVPGARFRVRQYIAPLAARGILLRELWTRLGAYPPRSRLLRPAWLLGTLAQRLPQLLAAARDDIVLLQRELVSTLPTLEGLTRRPRVVDIDDAVHLYRGGIAARRLAALADLVIVGNSWLAEVWRQWTPSVEILPTAVDTDLYAASPLPERASIGWIGSYPNLRYLQGIAPSLAQVLSRFPQAEIVVCCDQRPDLGGLPIRYVPWSMTAEVPFLASISIGIMPLDDSEWERGKCSFKMLQYMAAARPCVASPVGMNGDILKSAAVGIPASTAAQWTDALCDLISDRKQAQKLGIAGRALAVSQYSVTALVPRLAGLLRRIA